MGVCRYRVGACSGCGCARRSAFTNARQASRPFRVSAVAAEPDPFLRGVSANADLSGSCGRGAGRWLAALSSVEAALAVPVERGPSGWRAGRAELRSDSLLRSLLGRAFGWCSRDRAPSRPVPLPPGRFSRDALRCYAGSRTPLLDRIRIGETGVVVTARVEGPDLVIRAVEWMGEDSQLVSPLEALAVFRMRDRLLRTRPPTRSDLSGPAHAGSAACALRRSGACRRSRVVPRLPSLDRGAPVCGCRPPRATSPSAVAAISALRLDRMCRHPLAGDRRQVVVREYRVPTGRTA